jgi:hypothetical protein
LSATSCQLGVLVCTCCVLDVVDDVSVCDGPLTSCLFLSPQDRNDEVTAACPLGSQPVPAPGSV